MRTPDHDTLWRAVEDLDWTRLSPRAKETLATIAVPVACGVSQSEVARKLGVASSTVNNRMTALRRELLAQVPADAGPSS